MILFLQNVHQFWDFVAVSNDVTRLVQLSSEHLEVGAELTH